MQFSRRFSGWVLGICVLLLAGCATGPQITSEADPEADFGGYRTFGFYAPLALEKEGYATPTTDRIKAAARAQLESRGYVYTPEQPDLWVNLNAYMQKRTDVTSFPTVDYNYYYSYRARSYFAVPFWHDETHVRQYTEGTLNVDLVDRRKNRLVWEGIAVGRIAKLKPEQRAARIDSTVAEIFARYPYRAGSAAAAVRP
ncbi:DUF4136 domain-containing protein [Pseudoxanthomonas sacheonensis]|uniref:DUF4136 domain-containing protein n=1 Tax=Pseudoxanthomonas sacheonensis TaxID=443615 RepID=A0ABU1RVN7_9GAMM|nr:DUF4136 domain-containing protein [Pseudoxanthomonas sacheonensis]MDR6842848.1 hypothetical protein [Pseudoxanthomonas sacheonensis]